MRKSRCYVPALTGAFIFLLSGPANSLELDPFPTFDFSRDPFSVSIFREERPSFYWVNIGVPDRFFSGVQQTFAFPSPTVYSVRSMEYGVRLQGWVDDKTQIRMTFPFEANAVTDPSGNTHNVSKVGDIEAAACYLLLGKRENGGFVGLDGWYRFPTGTNPFQMDYPLLSTGKGAPAVALGVIAGEEVGGFSFFQSIHYEKTDPIYVDSSNLLFGQGDFQWPDYVLGVFRGEWMVFQRARRALALYYQLQMRFSGPMQFDQVTLDYGQMPGGKTTDQLFVSKVGVVVQVDQAFSAEGSLADFPFDFVTSTFRPDSGWIFSLSLIFRPF